MKRSFLSFSNVFQTSRKTQKRGFFKIRIMYHQCDSRVFLENISFVTHNQLTEVITHTPPLTSTHMLKQAISQGVHLAKRREKKKNWGKKHPLWQHLSPQSNLVIQTEQSCLKFLSVLQRGQNNQGSMITLNWFSVLLRRTTGSGADLFQTEEAAFTGTEFKHKQDLNNDCGICGCRAGGGSSAARDSRWHWTQRRLLVSLLELFILWKQLISIQSASFHPTLSVNVLHLYTASLQQRWNNKAKVQWLWNIYFIDSFFMCNTFVIVSKGILFHFYLQSLQYLTWLELHWATLVLSVDNRWSLMIQQWVSL